MDHLQPLLTAYFPQLILAVILLYVLYLFLTKFPERQNIFLLAFGYLVYGLLNWQHLLMLVAVTLITFAAGLRLGRAVSKRGLLLGSVIILLAVLFYFRYLPLLSQSVFSLLQPGGEGISIGTLVPLGISFYMLQAIAYLIDIYNGKLKPSANFVHVALYLSFIFKVSGWPHRAAAGVLAANSKQTLRHLRTDQHGSLPDHPGFA